MLGVTFSDDSDFHYVTFPDEAVVYCQVNLKALIPKRKLSREGCFPEPSNPNPHPPTEPSTGREALVGDVVPQHAQALERDDAAQL